MYNIQNIKNYILFLKRECGLYITLHPHDNESIITSSELITFNIHNAAKLRQNFLQKRNMDYRVY